jgi:hypothetical protein
MAAVKPNHATDNRIFMNEEKGGMIGHTLDSDIAAYRECNDDILRKLE